jgi:hypothetical protein
MSYVWDICMFARLPSMGFNSHLNREINHVFIPSDFGFLRILHLYAMAA